MPFGVYSRTLRTLRAMCDPIERVPPHGAWLFGVTGETTRDVLQEKLIGPPFRESEWGTGMIPKAAIAGVATSRGIPAAIDTVNVRHISGTKAVA